MKRRFRRWARRVRGWLDQLPGGGYSGDHFRF